MPQHIVVDGSNIATEGRNLPSLKQLNEAVMAFIDEHPDALITVVVDATFGHRIDAKEVAEFDDAVSNNELVAPPAGAVGRGDAFLLSIANKVHATILSNDSFQEFHGQYTWLFDEGRLIGGKPVPHIGWVFVTRVPVRGPISRKAVSEAKRRGPKGEGKRDAGKAGSDKVDVVKRQVSKEASLPMPVPAAPPPNAVLPGSRRTKQPAPVAAAAATAATQPPVKATGTNDLLPFLTFVEQHPPGSSVNAIVEHYSSHGAYVNIGDVKGYVPLRAMADPPPRSAREFMKIGESVTLVVESYVAARRSIDLATPAMATVRLPIVEPAKKAAKAAKAVKRAAKEPTKAAKAAADAAVEELETTLAEVAPPPLPDVAPAPTRARARRGAKPASSVEAAPVEAAAEVEAVPAKRSRRTAKASPAPEPEVLVEAPAEPAKPARRARKAAAEAVASPTVETPPRPAKRAAKKAASAPAEPAVVAVPAARVPEPGRKPRRGSKRA